MMAHTQKWLGLSCHAMFMSMQGNVLPWTLPGFGMEWVGIGKSQDQALRPSEALKRVRKP